MQSLDHIPHSACFILPHTTVPIPIACLQESELLSHLASLSSQNMPHSSTVSTPTLQVDLTRVMSTFVLEYFLLHKEKQKVLRKFITKVAKRDKLKDEIESGHTTLDRERDLVERDIQTVCAQTKGTRWETRVSRGVYPPFDQELDHMSDSVRGQTKSLLQTTRREYVFELLNVATYLGMNRLVELCATQINKWRQPKMCGLLGRAWSMSIHTRVERLAAVEALIALKRRRAELAEKWAPGSVPASTTRKRKRRRTDRLN